MKDSTSLDPYAKGLEKLRTCEKGPHVALPPSLGDPALQMVQVLWFVSDEARGCIDNRKNKTLYSYLDSILNAVMDGAEISKRNLAFARAFLEHEWGHAGEDVVRAGQRYYEAKVNVATFRRLERFFESYHKIPTGGKTANFVASVERLLTLTQHELWPNIHEVMEAVEAGGYAVTPGLLND